MREVEKMSGLAQGTHERKDLNSRLKQSGHGKKDVNFGFKKEGEAMSTWGETKLNIATAIRVSRDKGGGNVFRRLTSASRETARTIKRKEDGQEQGG